MTTREKHLMARVNERIEHSKKSEWWWPGALWDYALLIVAMPCLWAIERMYFRDQPLFFPVTIGILGLSISARRRSREMTVELERLKTRIDILEESQRPNQTLEPTPPCRRGSS